MTTVQPKTKGRKKSVTLRVPPPVAVAVPGEASFDELEQQSSTLIKYKQSRRSSFRKSSIPFADRAPKVRFDRTETCVTSTQPGPHAYIYGGSSEEETILEHLKPILRTEEHSFDMAEPSSTTTTSTQEGSCKILSTEEIMVCVSLAQRIIVQFSKAERQIRSVFDILSFPDAIQGVELMGRLKGVLMISIDCLQKVALEEEETTNRGGNEVEMSTNFIAPENTHKSQQRTNLALSKVNHLIESLLAVTTTCTTNSKKFLTTHKRLSLLWDLLLNRKGPFQVQRMKTTQDIYQLEAMPESVTLYEDFVEAEGTLTIEWSINELRFNTDTDSRTVVFDRCSLEDKYTILHTVLHHAHELLKTASNNFERAVHSISDASLYAGYESVKSRIVGLQLDSNVDPLAITELKNTLSELASRKSELLNLSGQLEKHITWLYKLVDSFHKFSTQILNGEKKGNNRCKRVICGPCGRYKFVTCRQLFAMMGKFPSSDLWIAMPLPSRLQPILTRLQNTSSTPMILSRKQSTD